MMVLNRDERASPQSRLVTNAELRQLLLPIPKSTVDEMARRGRLPGVVHVGRKRLYDVDKIRAWIDAGGEQRRTP